MSRALLYSRQGFDEAMRLLHASDAPRHRTITLVPSHTVQPWVYYTIGESKHDLAEDKLQEKYREMFTERSACMERIHPAQSAVGIADLVGVFHGNALAVELKTGKHRMRPEDDWRVAQKKFARRWVAAGGIYVLTNALPNEEALLPHKR